MQAEVDQEESEQNEVDGMKEEDDSTGMVMHIKEQLVICNEEDTDSRARVRATTDKQQVLHLDRIDIMLGR